MRSQNRFIERLAWLLDESIRLPGGYRIGIDGFIGLIPGFGDLAGGLLSSTIIYHANRIGVPRMVLARMVVNMIIDVVVGAVPIVGDLFDFVWKANRRNLRLLQQYQDDPQRTQRRSTVQTGLFGLLLLGILVLLIFLIVTLVGLLWAGIAALISNA